MLKYRKAVFLLSCNKAPQFDASGSEENTNTELFTKSPNTSEGPLLEKVSKGKKKSLACKKDKSKETFVEFALKVTIS